MFALAPAYEALGDRAFFTDFGALKIREHHERLGTTRAA